MRQMLIVAHDRAYEVTEDEAAEFADSLLGHETEGGLRFFVRDEGPGFGPGHWVEVYDPRFRFQ